MKSALAEPKLLVSFFIQLSPTQCVGIATSPRSPRVMPCKIAYHIERLLQLSLARSGFLMAVRIYRVLEAIKFLSRN